MKYSLIFTLLTAVELVSARAVTSYDADLVQRDLKSSLWLRNLDDSALPTLFSREAAGSPPPTRPLQRSSSGSSSSSSGWSSSSSGRSSSQQGASASRPLPPHSHGLENFKSSPQQFGRNFADHQAKKVQKAQAAYDGPLKAQTNKGNLYIPAKVTVNAEGSGKAVHGSKPNYPWKMKFSDQIPAHPGTQKQDGTVYAGLKTTTEQSHGRLSAYGRRVKGQVDTTKGGTVTASFPFNGETMKGNFGPGVKQDFSHSLPGTDDRTKLNMDMKGKAKAYVEGDNRDPGRPWRGNAAHHVGM